MRRPWSGTQPPGGWHGWSRGKWGEKCGSAQRYYGATARFIAGEGCDGGMYLSGGPGLPGGREGAQGGNPAKENLKGNSFSCPLFLCFCLWLRNWREGLGQWIPCPDVQGPGAPNPPLSGAVPSCASTVILPGIPYLTPRDHSGPVMTSDWTGVQPWEACPCRAPQLLLPVPGWDSIVWFLQWDKQVPCHSVSVTLVWGTACHGPSLVSWPLLPIRSLQHPTFQMGKLRLER